MSEFRGRLADLSPERRALLALKLRKKRLREGERSGPTRRSDPSVAPLTFSQERLWHLYRVDPGPAYNTHLALSLEGPLDVPELARTLTEIERRHEALRTRFHDGEKGPRQIVLPAGLRRLPLVDLSRVPEAAVRPLVEAAASLTRLPFDLEARPPVRTALLRIAPARHALLLVVHHIVIDGWSWGVLLRDLARIYGGSMAGTLPSLPDLPVQLGDYAAWQRRAIGSEALDRQRQYWIDRLAGYRGPLELIPDGSVADRGGARGGSVVVPLPAGLVPRLRELGRDRGVSLFVTCLAAFQALLGRVTGRDDVVVGSPVAGRDRAALEPLIGLFINLVALRADLADDPPFEALLGRGHTALVEAHENQDVPFEVVAQAVAAKTDGRGTDLVQVTLQVQEPLDARQEIGDVRVSPLEIDSGFVNFDLVAAVEPDGAGGRLVFRYRKGVFERHAVHRLCRRYATLLQSAVDDPGRRVSELQVLPRAETHLLVREWSGTEVHRPADSACHELLRAVARERPESVAVSVGERFLTFRELEAQASRLATRLRSRGAGVGTVVGVHVDRSPALVVALLAVLEAGAAYLYLDPSSPLERLRFQLEDSGVSLGLRDRDPVAEGLGKVEWISVDGTLEAGGAAPVRVDPDHLAYVIYTSGSTGRPKGVQVSHRSLVGYLRWARDRYRIGDCGSAVVPSGMGFDLTVTGLWGALLSGREVRLTKDDRDPGALQASVLEAPAPVFLKATPSYLDAAAETADPACLTGRLGALVVGGEALLAEAAERWRSRGTVSVFNEYGPTEATVGCCVGPVEVDVRGAVPIGRPSAGTRLYLAAADLRPAAAGTSGELCIGGSCLARGYARRPELTAERFVPDPFSDGPGLRLYRTGDLVRHLHDGRLLFLGRADRQVKIRGYRVEPGEIEARLEEHPGVRRAAVVPWTGTAGRASLVAYVVPGGPGAAPDELAAHLAQVFPEALRPSRFVVLPELPLTPRGKIDLGALPDPGREAEPADPSGLADPVQELVAGVWGEVLGGASPGPGDDFFEAGGDSILAIQAAARLSRLFDVKLLPRSLFDHSTVAGLAGLVHRLRRGDSARPPVTRTEPPEPGASFPLSYAQEQLWFLQTLDPESSSWTIFLPLRLRGELDLAAFQASLDELLRRHAALRTRFSALDGKPVQTWGPAPSVTPRVVDLSSLPVPSDEGIGWTIARQALRWPFDLLGRDALLRVLLVRVGTREHRLLITVSHIIFDGRSLEILVDELVTLYGSRTEGRPAELPELPVEFRDYVAWQREWVGSEGFRRQLDYWKRQLRGAPARIDLPMARPRPERLGSEGGKVAFELEPALAEPLSDLGRRTGATRFVVLLAGFKALLHAYVQRTDILVASPVTDRVQPGLERLVGPLVNLVVLRTDLGGDPEFRELLGRVREVVLSALDHQDVPFQMLPHSLGLERSPQDSPLFQIGFNYQRFPVEGWELERLAFESWPVPFEGAQYELNLALVDRSESVVGSLQYNRGLFDASSARALVEDLETVYGVIAEEPGIRLGSLVRRVRARGERRAQEDGVASRAALQELLARRATALGQDTT